MNNIGVASLLFFITYINVYYELRIANCELVNGDTPISFILL